MKKSKVTSTRDEDKELTKMSMQLTNALDEQAPTPVDEKSEYKQGSSHLTKGEVDQYFGEDGYESPYCNICEACGEEGCCSPCVCKQHPEGDYCEGYLTDLKFSYAMHQRLLDKLDETGWPDTLKKWYDDLYDENYSNYYSERLKKTT